MKKIYSFALVLLLLVTSVFAYYNMYSGDDFESVVVNNNIDSAEEVVYPNEKVVYVNLEESNDLRVFKKNDSDYYIYEGRIFEEEKIVRCHTSAPESRLFYIKCPN